MSMKNESIRRPGRVASAVREWLGIPMTLTDEDTWSAIAGSSSVAGVNVTASTAMQVSAVWACVRLISETIATLPFGIFERAPSGKRPAPHHPLHFMIHDQPNTDSSASVFWEAMVASMLLRGAGRAEKLQIGGRLVGLMFLNPDRLTSSRDSNGKKEWRYTGEDGRQRVIPRDRIWEVPGFTLDGKNGVSVIAYGAQVFGAAIAAERAASRTFVNGMLQTVYYKVAAFLKKEQRAEFKKNVLGAVERGETPLLEGGTDVGTIGIKPSDSQLLESRAFSVEEVCRWFRTDPSLVGHGQKDSNWGTGLEQKMIWFLTFTLAPWLKRIEQAVNKDLLAPGERSRFYSKYSVEGLLRADSAARAAFYAVMVNNGIMTRDEVRELEDKEPLGGNAAVLTVQSAMTTLDSLGSTSEAQAVRNSLLALLGLNESPAARE